MLKKAIIEIRKRYVNEDILVAGDFNDNETHPWVLDLKEYRVKSYSRFNNQERKNTRIDKMYSNRETEIGTLAILRANQESVEELSLRKRLQSDHLALITYV